MKDLIPVQLTYKQLFDLYGKDQYEIPYSVKDTIFVMSNTGGFTPILFVIKKKNHNILHIDFEDSTSFECSEGHLFSQNNSIINAAECTAVDTQFGNKKVVNKQRIGVEDVYDISVPPPHWYIHEPGGIIHHNTFFSLAIAKNFQEQHKEGVVIIYDTESATTKKMMTDRGLDPSRVLLVEPETVQEFKTHVLKVLDQYMKTDQDARPKMLMILDSLGQLSTSKELEDTLAGKETRDMTRAQLIKSAFRTIRLKLAKAKIPLIVTNHTYSTMDLFSKKVVSGGSGSMYASDYIVMLSKRKDEEGSGVTKVVTGNIITLKVAKSRLTKENSKVEALLEYAGGLDRYYGLLPFALKAGIFTKMAKGYDFNGKRVYETEILSNPEKFYTQEILEKIDQTAKKLFLYGLSVDDIDVPDLTVNEEPELLQEE